MSSEKLNVIVVALSLLLFSTPCVSAAENQGSVTSRYGILQYDNLMRKAQAEGKVRIIIGFKTPFIPEGKHATTETRDEQRLRISQMQESLLASMNIPDVSSIKRFRHIPFMAIRADEASLRAIINNPMVSNIEEDSPSRSMISQYNITLIGVDKGEANEFTGAGQTIAILDSGVDSTHSFMSGKIVSEACFSTNDSINGITSLCPNGKTSQTGSGAGVNCPTSLFPLDCSHGTYVAGIAAGKELTLFDGSTLRGVAPDSNIIDIQVYSKVEKGALCSPSTSPCIVTFLSDMLSALDYVTTLTGTYAISSVNISAAGSESSTTCDTVHPSFKAAVDQLGSFGIATVIASGNDGNPGGVTFPACISSAVSVGATEYYGNLNDGPPEQVAPYSNSASFLSLLAPGGCLDNLMTCGILSSTPVESEFGAWAYAAGTSASAPHVAGAWALLKQKKPLASVDEVLATLQWTGQGVYDPKNGLIKPRIQVDDALVALSDNCAAILSNSLLLHDPIVLYDGQPYWADLRYTQGLNFTVVDAGIVADTSPYMNCAASTLSNDFTLHMPEVIYRGVSYIADFQYAGGVTFTLTGAGTK